MSNLYEYPSFIETIKRRVEGESLNERPRICYEKYEKLILNETNSLEILVDIALEEWLKRL